MTYRHLRDILISHKFSHAPMSSSAANCQQAAPVIHDYATPAHAAGWRKVEHLIPGQALCGVVRLWVAESPITVRLLVNTDVTAQHLFFALTREIQSSPELESYVVIEGFSSTALTAMKGFARRVEHRRVTVGRYADYLVWLCARLGPLAGLPSNSPLRRLCEPLLKYTAVPEPKHKVDLKADYTGSRIKPQYDYGAKGVQAFETLLGYTHGLEQVSNVESKAQYQRLDVDLLVQDKGTGSSEVMVEVKTEKYKTGNISLERRSNLTLDTPGWLLYSKAEVLVSILWPTGDALLMDMERIRDWVRANKHRLRLVEGTVPQQSYKSQLYLGDVNEILAAVPESVHLRIGDWLPWLYQAEYLVKSLVVPAQDHKTLLPKRFKGVLPPSR